MRKFTKLFTNKIKSIDEEARQASFVISTDQVDRSGEIVAQDWDLENYKKNPIVLFGHDPSIADNVLGKCIEIHSDEEDGLTKTTALVQFAEEGTSKTVDTVWKLIKQDILRTVSVGFIPHAYENEDAMDEPTVLRNNELLEFSIVPIPANPNAVALAFGDGSITEKDARFMVKSYEAEAKLLKQSLYDTIKSTTDSSKSEKEKKAMSDEEIAKIAEAVGTAVENAIAPKLEEILDAVKGDEDKPEDKPEEDKPEDDKPMGGDGDTSNAKSEQDDEDGAYDENEELDEEAEKQFLAELEKDYNELNQA